jgi:hypothetical protein
LQVQTTGWNSASAHVGRTDNPHGVTAAQVGALTNNQANVSLNGGVVAVTNQLGALVSTNHTGDVSISGKFDVVGLHASTGLHIDSESSGTNIIDAGHETQFKGDVRLNARSANLADSLRIWDDGTEINFQMQEQTNSPYSATRSILLRARNKSVYLGYNTGFYFDNNSGSFPVGGPYVFNGAGNVGIGTNQPGERLVVVGNTIITGKVTAAAFFGNGGGVTNINGASLLSGSVGSSQMASNAVTSTQILDGTLVAPDYADNSISTGKLDSTVDVRYVNASGDTMTGYLNLPVNGLRVGATGFIMTNDNVGIGTNLPSERLTVDRNLKVVGTGSFGRVVATTLQIQTNAIYVTQDGNVGLGTNTPDAWATVTIGGNGLYVVGELDADGPIGTSDSFYGDGSNLSNLSGASLQAGSVAHAALANSSVDSNNIAANAIGVNQLAANAVTSVKIQAGSVDGSKLASGIISNVLLGADAVTSAKIQDGTIASNDYASGSISTGKLDATVDARYVNASGDSMSGTLFLTNNGLSVGITQLVVTANRVGIGTNSPTKTLDVRGDVNVSGVLTVGSISGVGTGLTGITAAQVGAAASVHTHSQYMTNGQILSFFQYPLALTNETYTGDVKTNRNNIYMMGTTQSFDAVVAVTLKGDGSAITNLSGSALASLSITHESLGLNSVKSENLDDGSVATSKLSSAVFNTFAPKNLSSYAGNNITYSNNQFHSGAGYSDVQATNAVWAAWPGVDTNAADDLKVSGGTMVAPINMGTNRITQLADAVDNEDAVNKRFMYQAISNSVYYVPEMGDLSMGSFNSQP